MGFWAVHVDSMAWSIGLGIVFCSIQMGRIEVTHLPKGFINFVEFIVELVDNKSERKFSRKTV